MAVKDFTEGLVTIAEKLRNKIKANHVFITLGEEGVLIHSKKNQDISWSNDLIPAMNVLPKDPAGGGEALLLVSSLSLIVGASIWEAAYLGSIAASCQVGRVGNNPLSKEEILREINKKLLMHCFCALDMEVD